ncbi:MAG: YibE/F family protein [Spirochaetes bacterium]|nr:YibE/F family protein [Spirochaetota bacterium]
MNIKRILNYTGSLNIKKRDLIFVLLFSVTAAVIIIIPNGFEKALVTKGESVKAEITDVDNDNLHSIGIIKTGEQLLRMKILNGKFKNCTIDTVNHFLGKLDLDKVYVKGNKVFAVLDVEGGKLFGAQIIDRYRLNYTFYLMMIFILLLLIYAGWTGLKIIISFLFSAIVIWKILLPGYLKMYDPVFFSLLITFILTFCICFLIAGFTKMGLTAFSGSVAGILLTALLSVYFGSLFKIPGEIMPYSETLLYTGFMKLKLSKIFIAGIFISSSGAVIDVAMDVAAAMSEVAEKKLEIRLNELIISGFNVGKAVIGTMTTTLLFAYSSAYSSMLMVFIAQGVPLTNILNYQIFGEQMLLTVVGCFGLVSVAPLTAIAGGFIFTWKKILVLQ